MSAIEVHNLVEHMEAQVEKHLRAAVHTFQNMPAEALLRKPHPEGWSIVQCLWHLNSYGDFYLPQIRSRLQQTASPNPHFTSGWLGSYFIRMMDPQSGKKYQAFRGHIPPEGGEAYATVAAFITQQEELLSMLEKARYANLNARVPISISSFIKLKLGDVLQFMVMHNERHMQQAMKLI